MDDSRRRLSALRRDLVSAQDYARHIDEDYLVLLIHLVIEELDVILHRRQNDPENGNKH